MNLWAKLAPGILFAVVGMAMILGFKKPKIEPKGLSHFNGSTDYIVGGILAFLNPPVLLFWIVSITLVETRLLPLNDMIATADFLVFLTGVFIGKWAVLWTYARFANRLNRRTPQTKKKSPTMGYALLAIGLLQVVRWVF